MRIHFEPKIIIGSVFGFIASAIGLIAVFFPSIFNLERQTIHEINIKLDSNNSYNDLYNFLLNNQGKIVKIVLTYKENNRKYAIEYKDFFSNDKNNIIDPIKENIIPSYGLADINDNAIVLSSLSYVNKIMREKGSIGIWYRNSGDSSDKQYVIVIPVRSDNNLLYRWFLKEDNDKQTMELSGVFFVNNFSTDKLYIGKVPYTMPQSFIDEKCKKNSGCPDIEIIVLDPLSKKEIIAKDI